MREIKFSIVLQHEETGRIVDRRFSYVEVFNGTAKDEIGKLEGYAVIARREYIGLNDKNGKEIYEGDIIKYEFDSKDSIKRPLRIDEVKYVLGCFIPDIWRYQKPEVIGNIYENPELANKN